MISSSLGQERERSTPEQLHLHRLHLIPLSPNQIEALDGLYDAATSPRDDLCLRCRFPQYLQSRSNSI